MKEAAHRSMAMGRRMIGQSRHTLPKPSLYTETGQGSPYFVYTFSTQMAEVEVDMKTGAGDGFNLVAPFDIGKAINPIMVEGQMEGGVMMGLGYAFMEEVVMKDGMIQNLNLQDYIIPSPLDTPEIKPIYVEYLNAYSPFGAQGIGEMSNILPPR